MHKVGYTNNVYLYFYDLEMCHKVIEASKPASIRCHRLHGSSSTAVTMTSKINGKTEIFTPVDLKPPKILKPKLD